MTEPLPSATPGPDPATPPTAAASPPQAPVPPVPEWDPGVSDRFGSTGPATEAPGGRGKALAAIGVLGALVVWLVARFYIYR
jgi:hypothetical protein